MTDETEELQKMFLDYANQLEEKILLLKQTFDELNLNFNDTKFNEFYRSIHNLKGSAGLYCYQEIHQIAAELDAKVKNLSQKNLFIAESSSIAKALHHLYQAWLKTSLDNQLKKFITSMTTNTK